MENIIKFELQPEGPNYSRQLKFLTTKNICNVEKIETDDFS